MILITSASYVNPELQAEFGKIPSSFLPLGAKRLYEHQVKLFENSNESIVLSLPESYVLDEVDEHKLFSLGVQIVFVKDGLSLGQSIVYVLNMLLPIDGHLSILHGDTLFITLEKESDSIEISKVNTHYNWEYVVNSNKTFITIKDYKPEELKEYVLSGYFNFSNAYDLIKCIVKCGYSFIKGIKLYSELNDMKLVKNDTWLDFGLSATYFHSRKSFTTERSFNSLVISDGYVTKCSEKIEKLQSEINWYQKVPNNVMLYIPKFEVVDGNKCYKTEYLYLSNLSELFVFGKLPDYVWKQIFNSIKQFLNLLHSHRIRDLSINFNYKQKTKDRLAVFTSSKKIDLNNSWTFNGVGIPSINTIVDELDSYMNTSDVFSFIHGDFCMSNIMYDFRSNLIKVFDPRGMDFDHKITEYGKSEYDNAKLMHSVFGLYDFIISEFYILTYENYDLKFKLETSKGISRIQEIYQDLFDVEEFESLYAIMIHLFLSMLPLHDDNEKRQYALLANAFRLYLNLKRMKNDISISNGGS